jgi:uncharacterized protein
VTARLTHIYRHPIKSHGRETLAEVALTAGQSMPWDRHWAVTHGASKWQKADPRWMACANFLLVSTVPALMAITAVWDETAGRMTLTHPARDPLSFCPDQPGDQAAFLAWVIPLLAGEREAVALVKAPGRGMTDTDYPSLSICNAASGTDLGRHLGADLSPLRWRSNLWVEGWDPWAEQALIGRDIRIGEVLLHVVEPIKRCKATTTNPVTGLRDVDTLQGLRTHTGAQNFGIYAQVRQGGTIRPGDPVEVLA